MTAKDTITILLEANSILGEICTSIKGKGSLNSVEVRSIEVRIKAAQERLVDAIVGCAEKK